MRWGVYDIPRLTQAIAEVRPGTNRVEATGLVVISIGICFLVSEVKGGVV